MADLTQVVAQLIPVVQQALGGALNAGGAGLIGKLREVGALSDFLTEAAEQFQNNTLIQGVIKGLTVEANPLDNLDLSTLTSDTVMTQVSGLSGLLADFGAEGEQVKQFIYTMAEKIVGASGSGLLGLGEKINENEQDFLTALRTTLGI